MTDTRRAEFVREERYTVLKISDAAEALDIEEKEMLYHLETKIAAWRSANGKAPLVAVVIEKDWPEYEPTWAAIKARMTGETK